MSTCPHGEEEWYCPDCNAEASAENDRRVFEAMECEQIGQYPPILSSSPSSSPPKPEGYGGVLAVDYRTHPLEATIGLALTSGRLQEEKPLSLLIAAPPGTGKSTIAMRFAKNPHVVVFNAGTKWGLVEELTRRVRAHDPPTHLIIPDFTAILGGSKEVVGDLKAMLTTLTEEGLTHARSYTQTVDFSDPNLDLPFGNLRVGVIAAMTRADLTDRRRIFSDVGFLSRFLPFSYELPPETYRRIADAISRDVKPHPLAVPNAPLRTRVDLDPHLLEKCASWTAAETPREKVMARIILRSTALSNGRKVATLEDVDEMNYLRHWWNLKYEALSSATASPLPRGIEL